MNKPLCLQGHALEPVGTSWWPIPAQEDERIHWAKFQVFLPILVVAGSVDLLPSSGRASPLLFPLASHAEHTMAQQALTVQACPPLSKAGCRLELRMVSTSS